MLGNGIVTRDLLEQLGWIRNRLTTFALSKTYHLSRPSSSLQALYCSTSLPTECHPVANNRTKHHQTGNIYQKINISWRDSSGYAMTSKLKVEGILEASGAYANVVAKSQLIQIKNSFCAWDAPNLGTTQTSGRRSQQLIVQWCNIINGRMVDWRSNQWMSPILISCDWVLWSFLCYLESDGTWIFIIYFMKVVCMLIDFRAEKYLARPSLLLVRRRGRTGPLLPCHGKRKHKKNAKGSYVLDISWRFLISLSELVLTVSPLLLTE